MPELLDELNVAKGCGTFKKTIKSYKKINLLILDEWLIRPLVAQESYDLLEIVKSRCEDGSSSMGIPSDVLTIENARS